MRAVRIAVVLAALLQAVSAVRADRVRLLGGGSISGEVTATSADAVTVLAEGRAQQVPIDKIRSVLYTGEPIELTQARLNAASGGYETALETLRRISSSDLGDERVRQDVEFFTAYATARLAENGAGDARAAVGALSAFRKKHKGSFHYYRTIEAIGDLAIALDRPDAALKSYGLLAGSSVASMKSRSLMLQGEALHADEQYAEAIERFDAALTNRDATRETRQRATFGKAFSLAASGDATAALDVVRRVIARTGEDRTELLAAGYNALGRCYEASDRSTDALLAYLHTDLLFDGDAATHAEALARLAVLWEDAGKPEEAESAARRLRARYAQTKWARRARSRASDD